MPFNHSYLFIVNSGAFANFYLSSQDNVIMFHKKAFPSLEIAAAPERVQGFTLIELSIVIVIIGLLVGGVLVGRDLKKAAEIRSVISSLEKYNTAVHTFRLKYNCLPGDCMNAAQFGGAARNNTLGRGDGNGLIEGTNTGANALCGEVILFWSDLSLSNLVDGAFIGGDGRINGPPCYATGLQPEQLAPKTNLNNAFLSPYANYTNGVRNFFQDRKSVV